MAIWRKFYTKTRENSVVQRRGAVALGVLAWLIASADDCGEVRLSVASTARALRITESEMRAVLDAFSEDGTIEVSGSRKAGSVVRFANWAEYNGNAQVMTKSHGYPTDKSRINHGYNTHGINGLNDNSTDKSRISHGYPVDITQKNALEEKRDLNNNNNARACEMTPLERAEADDNAQADRMRQRNTVEYPKTVQEVKDGARGIPITDEFATHFLNKYTANGWRTYGNVKIVRWESQLANDWSWWKQNKTDNQRRINGQLGGNGSINRAGYGQAQFSGDYSSNTDHSDEWS